MGLIFDKKNLKTELGHGTLKLRRSVPDILEWFATTSDDQELRLVAHNATLLLKQYQDELKAAQANRPEQLVLFDLEDLA